MDMGQTYTAIDIPSWEARLKSELAAYKAQVEKWVASGPVPVQEFNASPLRRAKLTLEMLRAGLSVRHASDGLILDDRVVLAVNVAKWRRCGLGTWEGYTSLRTVVTAAQASDAPDYLGPVPKTGVIRARFEELVASLGLEGTSLALPSNRIEAWKVVSELAVEHARRRADGSLPASPQQAQMAEDIAERLSLALPVPLTVAAAQEFVKAHARAFYAIRQGKLLVDAPVPAPDSAKDAHVGAHPPGPERTQGAPEAPRRRPRRSPDYSRQKRAKVPAKTLRSLGVSSVDDLVARVNALREAAGRPFVPRSLFPSGLANFNMLADELRASAVTAPHPVVAQDPRPPSPALDHPATTVAAPAKAAPPRPAYDTGTPLIDFVADNLGLLSRRQATALGRRFYVKGPWKGFEALGRELGVPPQHAKGVFSQAYEAFGKATGCWAAVADVLLADGPPATLEEMQGQAWHAGLPDDALLLVAAKSAKIHPVEVAGVGRYLAWLEKGDAAKLERIIAGRLKAATSAQDIEDELYYAKAAFNGRVDRMVDLVCERAKAGYEAARERRRSASPDGDASLADPNFPLAEMRAGMPRPDAGVR